MIRAFLPATYEIGCAGNRRRSNQNESLDILSKVTEQINQIMGKSVFGYDDDTLSSVVRLNYYAIAAGVYQ